MIIKRSYSKRKPKAFPLKQLSEKLQHQALKLLSREMKIVKRLLQLKFAKKIHELELNEHMSESDSLQYELVNAKEVFNIIKKFAHVDIARQIAKEYWKNQSQSPKPCDAIDAEDQNIDERIYGLYKSHRRTKDLLVEIETMIKSAIDKNNALRAEEQRNSSKMKKLNEQMTKRSTGTVLKIYGLLQ